MTGYCAIKNLQIDTAKATRLKCRTCHWWRLRTANELCESREEAEKP